MLIPRPQRWLPLASASEIWSFMFQKNGGLRYDRKKRCYIRVGCNLVEVSKEIYTTYHQLKRRERYLEERDRDCGVFSYHALDTGELVEKSCFPIRKRPRWRKQPLPRSCKRQLRRCLSLLPKPEQELLHAPLF